jgi:hypothetical protein
MGGNPVYQELKAGSESRLLRLPVVQLAKSVPHLPLRTLSSLVIGAPRQALPRWNNLFYPAKSACSYERSKERDDTNLLPKVIVAILLGRFLSRSQARHGEMKCLT